MLVAIRKNVAELKGHGTASRQLDQIMSKPDEVRKVFARDHQTLPASVSINTYLINTGSQLAWS
jgi:hypothetical protein